MRRIFVTALLFALSIILTANPAGAAKKLDQGQIPEKLQLLIGEFGDVSISTSRDSERALAGLGIPFGFVTVTESGFNVDVCKPIEGTRPRVCDTRLSITVREDQDRGACMFKVLRELNYWIVIAGTNDAATIAALRPYASTIEPYNSDGESRGRFQSVGEFTILSFHFGD